MAGSSIVNERRVRILGLLNEKKSVRVEELGEALGISLATVRRDLEYLNGKRLIVRRHGGAVPVASNSDLTPEKKLTEKDVINIEEKKAIARKAADLIQGNDILFMNAGSTVLFFLKELRGRRIKIITNNAAAISCEHDPLVELMILGGEYREQSQSLVGEFALTTIKNIYSTYTILGTNGVSLEQGLTTSVYQECAVNQAMINNTHEKVIVLADYSKIGKVSNFVSSPLSTVDILVTDDKCPASFIRSLEELGIQVLVASV
jgi:DeoR family fructose operon transcriptional repressor